MSAINDSRNNQQGRYLARLAKLRYVSDEEPGYSRRRHGAGFIYLNCHKKPLRKPATITRIQELVIPPAWKNVWICRFDNGHLQSTGYDSRDRKQYIYHSNWQETANLHKFNRLTAFGKALPSIRRKVRERLKGNELNRERVLAGIVAILDATSIRVGNEEYVAANNSFGLTTLRNRHLEFSNGHAYLKFRGKSGVPQELCVKNKNCVRLLKQTVKLHGTNVFQYIDDQGQQHVATSEEVNEFLQRLTDADFTAKDFRTWAASSFVTGILAMQSELESKTARKRAVRSAVKQAAQLLGNTAATARKYYIHPQLLAEFEAGMFPALIKRFKPSSKSGFTREEQLLAYFLTRHN
jgi:DNA topoisomerase I